MPQAEGGAYADASIKSGSPASVQFVRESNAKSLRAVPFRIPSP